MPSSAASPLILIAAAGLALGCLVFGFHSYRRRRLIDDTPTSKTQGVFIGLAEVKGAAESETPLTSFLAASRCVWYSYKVEEHWRRTSVGAKGTVQTQTGWSVVANDTRTAPIFVKDDTGILRVLPEGAEVHGTEVFKQEVKRNDPLYYGKGPEKSVSGSTHRRRFTEQAIPLHSKVYVIGQSRIRTDAVAAEIARTKGSMFIVSTHEEKHHSDRFKLWYWLWLGLGLIVAAGGAAIYNQQGFLPPPVLPIILTVTALYLVGALIGWMWTVYNGLVHLRQRVCQGLSQIDVELKRRADLIPNLVAAVQAFRLHESGLQQLVTELRSQQSTVDQAHATGLKGLAANLSIVVERYPDLKASGLFLALQRSLSEAEQRLALARDYYNSIATFYKTRLEVFPDGPLGRLLGFKPMALLEAASFERAPVEVKLAN